MIDMHTHILPGIDDGSDSIDLSLAMLREEKRQGVDEVCFTPHFYADEVSPEEFLERRETSWESLKPYMTEDMPKTHRGAEVFYFDGIGKVDSINKLCIDGGDLLLLEMPYAKWNEYMVDDIYSLMYEQNLRILLAHIERCLFKQSKDVYDDLLERGVIMQSNVSFFDSWKTGHKAKKLVENGRIHLIASDCHNMDSRPPNLIKCQKYFKRVEENIVERNVLR